MLFSHNSQLSQVMECVKTIDVTCNVGNTVLDVSVELHKKLLTSQQLYCPDPRCDFYKAQYCIEDLYYELKDMKDNADREWCGMIDDLVEIDPDYDWEGDIDMEHNIMCMNSYLCL